MENIIMNNGQVLDLDLVSKTTYGLEPDECLEEENEFWENEYKKFKEKKSLHAV